MRRVATLGSFWKSKGADVEDKRSWRYPDDNSGIEVVSINEGDRPRKVVLLHELGGLAPATMEFAVFLKDKGNCVVHMPVLFGRTGQDNKALGMAQLCWSRQLVLLLGNRRSKAADWLIRFCRHVKGTSDKGVTVIGMCATGGLVFSALSDESVAAGVSAQPSLPFRPFSIGHSVRSLGASVSDVQNAADGQKPFVAVAYTQDRLCPAGRLNQIDRLFPGDVVKVEGRGHSTLVYEPTDIARQAVLDLLEAAYR